MGFPMWTTIKKSSVLLPLGGLVVDSMGTIITITNDVKIHTEEGEDTLVEIEITTLTLDDDYEV